MMIPAGGQKRRLRSKALRQFKTEHVAIKFQRPFEIGHLQMHVANPDFGVNRRRVMSHNFSQVAFPWNRFH
jgi:hypothetical protein